MDLAAETEYINDLHSHIWDSWADENGSIGNVMVSVAVSTSIKKACLSGGPCKL